MIRLRTLLWLAALSALAVSGDLDRAAGAPPAQARSLNDGVYTQSQADRGLALWEKTCLGCHQHDQYVGYLDGWEGLPVSYLFDEIAVTMPEDNPGGLSREQYADILVYVFSINGAPAGDEEMGSDEDELEAIMIEVANGGIPR